MANVNISMFNPTRGKRIRKGIANAFLGLLIIAVGVGYLGNHLDFLPWTNFTRILRILPHLPCISTRIAPLERSRSSKSSIRSFL